jgi:predicted RNA binding protein YcfA (HicA-like mRNA interferase family)
MSKLPIISGKECIKALEKIGFVIFRQRGSHITMVRQNPQCQVTIPNHKTVAKGTLSAIIKQANLTIDEFIKLL